MLYFKLIPHPFSCEEKGLKKHICTSPSLWEERGLGGELLANSR